ncbi:MAG: hypothetical protein JNM17_03205 [Archangium sp.]|nr:hypothetical protein [Archangium sp.]
MAWGLIRAMDQFALVFTYVDPKRGPSAKGARVRGTEPMPEDARDACERPNVTVRIEPGLRVRPLSPEQFQLLALPEEPAWLVHVGTAYIEKPAPPPEPEPDLRRTVVVIASTVFALAVALLLYLYFAFD